MVSIDTGEDIIYTPLPLHPSFYHSYLSLFLYPITKFILFLTLYISLVSLTISTLTHLTSYYLSSPIISPTPPYPYPHLLSSPLLSSTLTSPTILSSTKDQCTITFPPPFPSRKRRRRVRVWRWKYCQFPWKYCPCISHPDPLYFLSLVLDGWR